MNKQIETIFIKILCIDYLNNNENISYSEMEEILKTLGFEVDKDGNITWE